MNRIFKVRGGRNIFSEIYKKFFVKFEEPLYVKKLKLEVLVQIANMHNFQDILNEMEEYVNDVNSNFSKFTIRKIGSLGLRVDEALPHIVSLLKSLVHRNVDYIVAEALSVLQHILRKFPAIIEEFINFLEPAILALDNDVKGMSSLIWILGEFGHKLDNAPYILENLIEDFSEGVQPSNIIYAVLLAGTKLFFKSPGEMQPVLGKIFELILKNYFDVDLRDRTLYIYNLMKKDINLAEFVICGEGEKIDNFGNELEDEVVDNLFTQFNTLSVVYQKTEEKFVKQVADDIDGVNFQRRNIDDETGYEDNEVIRTTNTHSNNNIININSTSNYNPSPSAPPKNDLLVNFN